MSDVRAVFFDAVGTVIFPDPSAAAVYADVANRYGGRRTAEEIRHRFAIAFRRQDILDEQQQWRTSAARERERWRSIVGEVLNDVTDNDACFQELWEHFSRPTAWRLADDVADTLQVLAARGLILGLASNYDGRLRNVVASLPALGPLEHMVISSEVGWRKPSIEFFAALSQITSLPPERILLVGDDLVNDYTSAMATGVRAILYDPEGRHHAKEIQRIVSLRELV
jgi:putative hydrolase of the HAD superfamily